MRLRLCFMPGVNSAGSLIRNVDGHATLAFNIIGDFERTVRALASSYVSHLPWPHLFSHDWADGAESDLERHSHSLRCHIRYFRFPFLARLVAKDIDIHHRHLGFPCCR